MSDEDQQDSKAVEWGRLLERLDSIKSFMEAEPDKRGKIYDELRDLRDRLIQLEVKCAVFGFLAGLIPSVIMFVLSMVFK